MKPVRSIATGLLVGPAIAFGVLAGASQAASASVTAAPNTSVAAAPTVKTGWGGGGYGRYGGRGYGYGGRGYGYGGRGYGYRGYGGYGYRPYGGFGRFADPCRYGGYGDCCGGPILYGNGCC